MAIVELEQGVFYDDNSVNSGSGNYDAFVRIQASPTEEGFNTDETKVLDNKDGNFTNSIEFGSIAKVTIGGVEYLEFRLDINESPDDITLTDLKIFISSGPATESDFDADFASFTPVYQIPGAIPLEDHESGSGGDDYGFYIPLSLFESAGATNNKFVTLYSSFSGSDGGFEEWRTQTQTNPGEPGGDDPGDDVLDYSIDKMVFDVDGEGAQGVVNEAGDVITYKIEIKNEGNVALAGVSVSDPLLADLTNDADNDDVIDGDIDNDGLLDVTETWTYTGTYTVLQSDIDNNGGGDGDIDNTATVSHLELEDKSDSAAVGIASLTIVKDTDKPSVDAAGQVINYTITVDNTGGVDLTNPVVTDDFADAGSLDLVSGDDDSDNVLDVNETWHYTATHTVTQAEMNAGDDLVNVAVVDTDQTEEQEDDATTEVDQKPSLTIVKDTDKSSVDAAGQVINYTITVDNTGNIDLTNPVVTDDFADAGSLDLVSGDDDSDNVLDVNETWHYTATHTVTQAEMNAGDDLVNVAVVDTDQTEEQEDDATTEVDQKPSLTIVKDTDKSSVDAAGQVINYTITVDNTGNIDLTNPVVTDDFADAGSLDLVSGDDDSDNVLDVNETWHYTATHTVTQAEMNAGDDLVNVAVVDTDQTEEQEDDATTEVDQKPSLTIVKDTDKSSVDAAGQVINYTITVDNTGNIDLTNPVVTDDFADAGSLDLVSGDDDSDNVLDVNETWHYTATHTVTQAEMNAGDDLVNVAVVDTDQTEEQEDDATTEVDQKPSLTIVKDTDKSSVDAAGQVINYTITVDNTGNIDLTNPVVTDDFADAGSLDLVSGDDDSDNVLDVNETWHYTATHTVTQAEMNAGDDLVNVAVVDTDQTEEQEDDATTTIVLHSDGYSQGYWKTHVDNNPKKGVYTAWDDGIATTDTYEGIKGLGFNTGLDNSITFKQVLDTANLKPVQANQELALAKQVVASLLNAADSIGSNATSDFQFSTADIKAAVASVYDGTGFNADDDSDGIRDSEELQKVLDFYNKEDITVQGTDPMYMTTLMGHDNDPTYANYLSVFG